MLGLALVAIPWSVRAVPGQPPSKRDVAGNKAVRPGTALPGAGLRLSADASSPEATLQATSDQQEASAEKRTGKAKDASQGNVSAKVAVRDLNIMDGGKEEGHSKQIVVIQGEKVIRPASWADYQRQQIAAKDRTQTELILFASTLSDHQSNGERCLEAADCDFVVLARETTISGKAKRSTIVVKTGRATFHEAKLRVSVATVGPDLDELANLAADVIQLDFRRGNFVSFGTDVRFDFSDRRSVKPGSQPSARLPRDYPAEPSGAASKTDRPSSELERLPSTASRRTVEQFGLELEDIPPGEMSVHIGRYNGGVRVASVEQNGLAAKNGIRPGDILVGLHKSQTTSCKEVESVLRRLELENVDPIKFFILRDAETLYGYLPSPAVSFDFGRQSPTTGTRSRLPMIEKALKLLPLEKNVEVAVVDPDETAECTLDPRVLEDGRGWVLAGPDGTALRVFVDTNQDNIVDQWRYYNGGREVHRDIDTDGDGRADRFLRFNVDGLDINALHDEG